MTGDQPDRNRRERKQTGRGQSGEGVSGTGALHPGLDLTETYVFLGSRGRAETVSLTDALWEEMADQSDAAAPSKAGKRATLAGHEVRNRAHLHGSALHGDGWIVSAYWLETDMTMWERHATGDRLIVAQSGTFTLVLDQQEGHRQQVDLESVRSALVPSGVWHRLMVRQPGLVLFVTPSHGTEHRLA